MVCQCIGVPAPSEACYILRLIFASGLVEAKSKPIENKKGSLCITDDVFVSFYNHYAGSGLF